MKNGSPNVKFPYRNPVLFAKDVQNEYENAANFPYRSPVLFADLQIHLIQRFRYRHESQLTCQSDGRLVVWGNAAVYPLKFQTFCCIC